jgi:hypothetical protein
VITSFLVTERYPETDIEELSDILVAEGLMSHTAVGELTDMEREMDRETTSDSDGLLVGAASDSQPEKKNLNGDVTALLLKARRKQAAAAKPKKKTKR